MRPSVADNAVLALVKNIHDYANHGITNTELRFTKGFIGQSDARRCARNEAKAEFLSLIQKYGLTADFRSKQNHILKQLTKAEVDMLAREYVNVNRMGILVVGDKSIFLLGFLKTDYRAVELDWNGNVK